MRSTSAPAPRALRYGVEQAAERERSEGLPAINRRTWCSLNTMVLIAVQRMMTKRPRPVFIQKRGCPARRWGLACCTETAPSPHTKGGWTDWLLYLRV